MSDTIFPANCLTGHPNTSCVSNIDSPAEHLLHASRIKPTLSVEIYQLTSEHQEVDISEIGCQSKEAFYTEFLMTTDGKYFKY